MLPPPTCCTHCTYDWCSGKLAPSHQCLLNSISAGVKIFIRSYRKISRGVKNGDDWTTSACPSLSASSVQMFPHKWKTKVDRRRAETTCLDGRSVAEHPSTSPIFVLGRSSTRSPLVWVEEIAAQSHGHPLYLFRNGCTTETVRFNSTSLPPHNISHSLPLRILPFFFSHIYCSHIYCI